MKKLTRDKYIDYLIAYIEKECETTFLSKPKTIGEIVCELADKAWDIESILQAVMSCAISDLASDEFDDMPTEYST